MDTKRPAPQRPITRSESQAQTREALLDAAEALVLEQSIPGLSLRAVCFQAGYTQGAFYSNFKDREALLLALMERNLDAKAASLEAMLATTGGLGLEPALDAVSTWRGTITHRTQWALVAIELQLHAARDEGFAAHLDAAQARIDRRFSDHIEQLALRNRLNPALPPLQIAQILQMLWRGMALRWAGRKPTKQSDLDAVFSTSLRRLLGLC